MANTTPSCPPKVPLVFRVGMVGHRPNRLSNADYTILGSVMRDILKSIKDSVTEFAGSHPGLYAADSPKLVAVSPCAEGSDRIFSAQAIELGYALHCPMPFAQAEYEKDFAAPRALEEQSLAAFQKLLTCAKSGSGLRVFELDGSAHDRPGAYRQAGNVVLNHSEVLLVVWDGVDGSQVGGTMETLNAAMSYNVPVIWIGAQVPHHWQVIQKPSELACLATHIRCTPVQSPLISPSHLVEEILDVPQAIPGQLSHGHSPKPDLRETYFAESLPRWNFAVLWKAFRNIVGANQITVPSHRVESFEVIADHEWPITLPGVAGWINAALGHHFVWADRLADYYADCYRSTFLLSFLGGAAAVFLAILPVWAGWMTKEPVALLAAAGIELAVLLAIIGFIVWGNLRRWHERWMEYRVLAELIREIYFLIPLGGGRPFARLFGHLGVYGSPTESWMSWHARALERAIGLPSIQVDEAYARAALGRLKSVVDAQVEFHESSHVRHHRIEERLHWGGISLFGLTAAVVALHFLELVVGLLSGHETVQEGMSWMTVVAAFLPVVGAAFAGISNQGEFARLAMRNEAMANRLQGLSVEIESILNRRGCVTLSEVSRMSLRVAQLMIDEVVDWRVIVLHRPLVPPA